jgi:pimeloyl-ACP methyl ester carboxylesterase
MDKATPIRSAASVGVALSDYPITRRFVDVGGRRVHGRILGAGPPALFIHSSPANSSLVLADMVRVANRYTCYAFDTPGFGLSDALPGETLQVADLADAMAETLAAIGMPPCPVFGCHTGGSIALELAARHPERVTGIVIDGLAVFTDEENAGILPWYFQKFPLDPLGGHYSSVWTRFRDQSTWFPWFARDPAAINESDLTTPESTNRWVTMYFDAQATYTPAYHAAMTYQDGPRQVASLQVPAVFTATESDMLYPHLDRIAPTRPDQEIRRVGNSTERRRALTGEAFARFGSEGQPPLLAATLAGSDRVVRQFVDVGTGQLMLRSMGDRAKPPLLVIHDVPGAGGTIEGAMATLAERYFVVAYDLPGCGESTPLDTPAAGDFAATLWQGCSALGLDRIGLLGVGFGSAIAVEMAASEPARTTTVALDGLLLANDDERLVLRRSYAPPVAIEPDGSHWFRTWQMIRDTNIWWPWFTPTRAALRRISADFAAEALHRRTCETLRQPGAWAAVVAAAFAVDSAARLETLRIAVTFVEGSANPLATAYRELARERFPDAEWRTLGDI